MPTGQDLTPAQANGGGKSVAPPNRYLIPVLVTFLTVGVFVGAIFLMMMQLRERLRMKVLQQDSWVLQAAATAQTQATEITDDVNEQMNQMLFVSGIKEDDVIGVRLFDRSGRFTNAVPNTLLHTQLSDEALETLRAGLPYTRFEAALDVSSEFRPGTWPVITAPILFTAVPIRSKNGELIAAAEFILNGEHVAGQMHEIDREVRASAIRFCSIGAIVIMALLGWAFSRLGKANQLLAKRSADLLRANHELTMAAKTSAVGAVAAHLIHGLKNPLFGLQAFVAVKSESEGTGEWKSAIDSAKRMQTMIADVVRIMREESGQSAYEVSVEELVGLLDSKLTPQAKESSVILDLHASAEGAVPNREANLIILVLTNLIQNAIQASKTGKKVSLEVSEQADSICFDVGDQAGGLPATAKANLFTPCQSSKAGGTGLGLAISKQLANHLGGRLELVKTDQEGTIFRLAIPRQLFAGKSASGKLEAENAVA
jgi:signal transduction histidine kinase